MRNFLFIYMLIVIGVVAYPNWGRAAPVYFPGGGRNSIAAPDRKYSILFFDPGENNDGFHFYSLFLERAHRRIAEILQFTRGVEVEWAPDGKSFFVTDFTGSSTADCLAFINVGSGLQKFSMANLVTTSDLPGSEWSQSNSHYYMHCDRWELGAKLYFRLKAVPDNGVSQIYSYIFDVKRQKVFEADTSVGTTR